MSDLTKLRVAFAPSGALEHSCSRFNLRMLRRLNLKQTSLGYFELPGREDGGADRDRTDDILLAKQALSQLSYSPIRPPV